MRNEEGSNFRNRYFPPLPAPNRATGARNVATGPDALAYVNATTAEDFAGYRYGRDLHGKKRVNKAERGSVALSSYHGYKVARKGFRPRPHPTHKVMTPAYTLNSNKRISNAGRPLAYITQSRNATRSVIYTPHYNSEQQYQFQLGHRDNSDESSPGDPSFLVTSPTSPKYTPHSSPAFLANLRGRDEHIFSPCYESSEGTNDHPGVASGDLRVNEIPEKETSKDKPIASRSTNSSIVSITSSSCSKNNSPSSSRSTTDVEEDAPGILCGDVDEDRSVLNGGTTIAVRVERSDANGNTTEVRTGDESDCRLEYDPRQPQYSPRYDPDPCHLLDEREYNPLFPAMYD